MGFYYFDYTYFLFMLPALLISMVAQFKVNSTFQKYSRVNTARNMTGADAAMRVMQYGGAYGVQSREGIGSTFWFEMDTVTPPSPEEQALPE